MFQTKIVCTPRSCNRKPRSTARHDLRRNDRRTSQLSHGTPEEKRATAELVRRVAVEEVGATSP